MIEPMLAESTQEPFNSEAWLFEPKLDGVRCIAYLTGETKLQARSGADISHKFPELASLHEQAIKPCVLDGEIVCGSFHRIQHRIHREKALDIRAAARSIPATFYGFDILYIEGWAQAPRPLLERKLALTLHFEGDERGRVLGFQNRDGVSLFAKAKEAGFEGIMAKRLTSTYQEGRRSPDWLKIKAFQEGRFLICGVIEGENERARTFGSLVLGKEAERGLEYVGNVGSGFSEAMLQSLLPILEGLKQADSPFPHPVKLDRGLKFWIKPFVWCEVRYLEVGSDGKLRFPTFRKLVSGC